MLEVARDYALMLLHIAVLCAVAPMMLVLSPFVYMIHYAASWPSVLGPSPPTGEAYLITGASVGLGAALATQLAAKPSTKAVYLVSRSAEHMETTRRACRAVAADPALTVRAIEADVQNADAMRRALIDADDAELSSGRPGLTCVVANAGVSKSTWDPDGNRDISAALDVIDINLQGALRSITPVVDRFLKRAYGQIVLVSSVASMVETLPCTMSYGASKAGLRHFGEALKVSLDGTGIDVLTVCPGFIDTNMTASLETMPEKPPMLSAREAAMIIADAMERRGVGVLTFPRVKWTVITAVFAALPHQFRWLLGRSALEHGTEFLSVPK